MKPYFTKYLPVDDEPNNSDIGVDSRGITMTYFAYKALGSSGTFKKVKLFLCSRDIKEDDTAYNILTHTEFKVEKVDTSTPEVYYMAFEVLSPARNTLKKIGPISEAALSFVKEGMEFDESEINLYKSWNKDSKQFDIPHHVKVKCSTCGKFH